MDVSFVNPLAFTTYGPYSLQYLPNYGALIMLFRDTEADRMCGPSHVVNRAFSELWPHFQFITLTSVALTNQRFELAASAQRGRFVFVTEMFQELKKSFLYII